MCTNATVRRSGRRAASIPGIKQEDIRPTPVAGVFEVRRGADIVYMTGDGQYVFTGDLYNVPSHSNLTEAHRRVLRQKLIESIPESQMVIFSPPQPKYTVTVFTDVDCAYCRELHRQIADYNRLGVRVRYIFFPRTGPKQAIDKETAKSHAPALAPRHRLRRADSSRSRGK